MSPTGSPSPRIPPSPGAHPRVTHGALIHHVCAAPYARHPPTLAPVREPHPSGSRVFPSSRLLNSPLCSSPRQRIPLQTAAANHRLSTPQDAVQTGGSPPQLGGKSIPVPPKKGQPHPDPPHQPPRQGRQGTVAACRCDSRSTVIAGRGAGGATAPQHVPRRPLPKPPVPTEPVFPRAMGRGAAVAASQASLAAGGHCSPTGRAR